MRSVEAEISAFLQTKVLTIDNVRKPYDLVRQRKGFGAVAEVVWILRPLIYGELIRFLITPMHTSLSLTDDVNSARPQEIWKAFHVPLPSLTFA